MSKIVELLQVNSLENIAKGDILKQKDGSKELVTKVGERDVSTISAGVATSAFIWISKSVYCIEGNSLTKFPKGSKFYIYQGGYKQREYFLKKFHEIKRRIDSN